MKNLIVISPQQTSTQSLVALDWLIPFSQLDELKILLINDGKESFAESNSKLFEVINTEFRYGWGGVQKTALRYGIENGFDDILILGFCSPLIGVIINEFLAASNLKKILHIDRRPRWDFAQKLTQVLLQKISGVPMEGWLEWVHHYSLSTIKHTLYELNTPADHFDTELIMQLRSLTASPVIKNIEISIPRPPISPNRLWNDFKACVKFRLQKSGFLYDIRFNPHVLNKIDNQKQQHQIYEPKFDDISPHSLILSDDTLIPHNSKVLDIGCSSGYLCDQLAIRKNCETLGIDQIPAENISSNTFRYFQMDLEKEAKRIGEIIENEKCDIVLMLDVLEHLSNPEIFLLSIFRQKYTKPPKFIFSTANVAFFGVRIMLLLGFFNYGERGILDITHKRLFSFRTFQNLMEQTGFFIRDTRFFPLPFSKIGFPELFATFFLRINLLLLKILPTLFSYQFMFRCELLSFPKKKAK